jgi:hypothetical protein
MFVSTYVPLTTRSPWFVVPAILVAVAVFVDLFGERLRKMRCIGRAAAGA